MDTINAITGRLADLVFAALAPLGAAGALVLISVVTGVLMLFVFRYVSNQAGIKHVRNQITANLLAIKLFRDEMRVMFRSQAGLLWNTVRLLGYQVKPLAVMIVPMVLGLAQMAMWYEFRPFAPGEDIYVKARFAPGGGLDGFGLQPADGLTTATPAVRIPPLGEYAQRFVAPTASAAALRWGGGAADLPVSIGDGFVRVRPVSSHGFWDKLLYPGASSPGGAPGLKSVEVAYPHRTVHVPLFSWLLGKIGLDHWLVHFFVISMIAALLVKPLTGVHL